MKMPGFTAEASLYERNTPYYMIHSVGTDFGEQSVIAAGLFDWFCKQFPWICGETPPPNQCIHYKTDTACVGISMWCNDRCRYPDGREGSSGWYPCGLCFGFSW